MSTLLYWCSYCRNDLPRESFYSCKGRSTGVTPGCKSCAKARARQWNKANPRRATDNAIRYQKRHPEVGAAWRQSNRAYLAEYTSRWRERSSFAGRRKGDGRTVSVTPSWANRFFIGEIYALARLRTKVTGIPWEVDHIVPLNSVDVCGLHVENNLRVVPRSVNRSKKNFLPKESDYFKRIL